MAKIGSPTKRPTSKGGFCGDPEEAAPQLVANRERRNNRGRSPRRLELDLWSFDRACVAGRSATRNISKHSGFAVPRARLGIYIAKRTPQKPTLQTAQGRHVRLIFGCNIQLESRDSIGSVARAIWTEEKLRSRPATWIALQG
jgi:hypothetical protein